LLAFLQQQSTVSDLTHQIVMMFNQRNISIVFELSDLATYIPKEGETLFYRALAIGNVSLALYFLRNGTDVAINDSGDAPLVIACELMSFELVSELVEKHHVRLDTEENLKILSQALLAHPNNEFDRANILKIANFLIQHGADVYHRIDPLSGEEITPLEIAIEKRYPEIVSTLISTHPDILRKNFKEGEPHQTLVHRAAQNNDLDVLQILLSSKDPAITRMIESTNQRGQTVLHVASESRMNLVMPHLLEDARVKQLINKQDMDGQTALHYVAKNKNKQMFNLLIHEGADPNIPNNENESPFSMAIANDIS